LGTVLDIAAVSMATEMRRVETAAHNIANVSTAGFKRQVGVAAPFASALQAESRAASLDSASVVSPAGAPSFATRADLSPGRLSQTQNSLHLALSGPGFFVLRQGEQTLYTRSGAFERAADGRVVNAQGAVLQANGGDLIVGSADFNVSADGTVVDEHRPIGRLALVDIDPAALAQRAAGSTFTANTESVALADHVVVKQGFLEMANVNLGQEMVQMMETMRRFELGQKLLQAHEDMMERAIRRLGDLQS
jgi:flagellar basal-body rod protein FlgG